MTPSVRTLQGSKIKSFKGSASLCPRGSNSRGFSTIQEQQTVKVDYNTVTYSSISTGNTFVFDAYDDRWFYRDVEGTNL